MSEDYSKTQMLKIHAPGLAWIPRLVRDNLTPALAGSAITTLFMGVAYLINSPQKDIHHVQEIIAQQQAHEAKTDELLQQIVTSQAVMSSQISDIAEKTNHNEDRWERVAEIAESPPHARRRPK